MSYTVVYDHEDYGHRYTHVNKKTLDMINKADVEVIPKITIVAVFKGNMFTADGSAGYGNFWRSYLYNEMHSKCERDG